MFGSLNEFETLGLGGTLGLGETLGLGFLVPTTDLSGGEALTLLICIDFTFEPVD